MTYKVEDGTWEVHGSAANTNSDIYDELGAVEHANFKRALQDYLVQYFNTGSRDCLTKNGASLAPVGLTSSGGGKCLKVRWALPGRGKSGSLRLLVVVHCQRKRVQIVGAWERKNDPTMLEMQGALDKFRGLQAKTALKSEG